MYPRRAITFLIDWAYHQYVRLLLWKNGQTSKRSTPSKFLILKSFIIPTSNFYFAGRQCTCCQSAHSPTTRLEISTHSISRPRLLTRGDDLLRHLHPYPAQAVPNWWCGPSYWTRSRLGICLRRVKVGNPFSFYTFHTMVIYFGYLQSFLAVTVLNYF